MPDDRSGPAQPLLDLNAAAEKRRAIQEARRFRSGSFDLSDFLVHLQKVHEMGPIEQLLGMIPGMLRAMQAQDLPPAERQFKRVEAIIQSMTAWERQHPDQLDGSRRRRVARGSGASLGEVGNLLTQFNEMRRMMNGPRGSGPSVA